MRFKKNFGVTFSSFGFLLCVSFTLLWAIGGGYGLAVLPPDKIGSQLKPDTSTVSGAVTLRANESSASSSMPHSTTSENSHPNPSKSQSDEVDPNPNHDDKHLYQGDESYGGDSGHGHVSPHQHDSANILKTRDCKLPNEWKGEWFESGYHSVAISRDTITTKGSCIERSGDKYLFYEKAQNCYRCLVITQPHGSVLQYKKSPYCEFLHSVNSQTLDDLCMEIPGDATLFSLFRIDAQPEPCPFVGPYTFTYNRGNGECKYPVSFIDTCTEPSRLRLRYQACPDVLNTESTMEELQCLAKWKEGSQHYLLGKIRQDGRGITTNEEAYRCFIYERTGHGYHMAISGDASCIGVLSPFEGARALVLTKVEEKEQPKCQFPLWLTSHHWNTLDGRMSAKVHPFTTMHITDDGRKNSSVHYSPSSSFSASTTGTFTFGSGNSGGNPQNLFTGGTRIVCQNTKSLSGSHVAVLAHHTEGCKSEAICMHIYKRTHHVTEVQMLKLSENGMEEMDCFKSDALGISQSFITLINPESKPHRCPNLGKYMISGVSQDGRVVRDSCRLSSGSQGSFHSVVVGCDKRATMEFHSKCPTQEPVTAYECHGNWEEAGAGFLIAQPLNGRRRYCFAYSESEEGLRVSSSTESCRRNGTPGIEGVWAFNLTVDGQCAEAMTASASNPFSCDILIVVSSASFVVLMTFSNLVSRTLLIKR